MGAKLVRCSQCGASRRRLIVDTQASVIARGERIVRCKPREIEFISLLQAQRGRPIAYPTLLRLLFGAHPPANPDQTLRGYISRARRALKLVGGFELVTVRGTYGHRSGTCLLRRLPPCRREEASA